MFRSQGRVGKKCFGDKIDVLGEDVAVHNKGVEEFWALDDKGVEYCRF